MPLAGSEGFEVMIASKVADLFIRVLCMCSTVQSIVQYIIQYMYSCGEYDVRQDAKT